MLPSRAAAPACLAALPAVLLLAFALYRPGLSGQFLLDDIPHLAALASFDHYPPAERLLAFVLSGTAGPTGRPLSLLSFLANDSAWPSSAYPYKYTNLLLHLLNGTLVCWIGFLLFGQQGRDHRAGRKLPIAGCAAVAAMAVWLLHPLNVSTVLYVIQRMTMLAATFSCIGIVLYLKGRSLARDRPLAGYGLMSAGVLGGVGLGMLSKENAILLPLYILVVEFTILNRPRPHRWKEWAWLFLGLPVLLLAGWHLWNFPGILDGYGSRPFTLGERLLTESRILWTYLSLILIPRAAGTGLFHDDFPVSHGWLSPPTTLFAAAGLLLLLALALRLRPREPWFSFAALWFLAGHLLESGIVPLELYFEHRNYVPMIGPIFALVHYISRIGKRLAPWVIAAGFAYVALSAYATWRSANVWGIPQLHAELSLVEHPHSLRATQFSAQQWLIAGNPEKSRRLLMKLAARNAENASLYLQILQLDCATGRTIASSSIETLIERLHNSRPANFERDTLKRIFKLVKRRRCPGLSLGDLDRITSTLIGNHAFREDRRLANLLFLQAEIRITMGRIGGALQPSLDGYELSPSPDKALFLAAIYHRLGDWEKVRHFVGEAERIGRHPLLRVNPYSPDIERWRRVLRQHQSTGHVSP